MVVPNRLLNLVAVFLAAIIYGVLIIYVRTFGLTVPFLDTWTIDVPLALTMQENTLQLSELWLVQAAHIQLVQRIILVTSVTMDSSWNLTNQLFLGIAFYGGGFVLLADVARRTLDASWLPLAIIIFALIVFNLGQHTNLIWTGGLLHWSPYILAVGAVVWGLDRFSSSWLSIIFLISVTAVLNLANAAGIVLIIAISMMIGFYGFRRAQLIAWGAYVVITIIAFTQIVIIDSGEGSDIQVERFWYIVTTVLSLLSTLFYPRPWQTPSLTYAITAVTTLLWALALLVWQLRRGISPQARPWFILLLTGLGTVAQIT
ncbi:MAG: hypothetical protein AAF125_23365, partial [Chloroflexota bacterium]